MSEYSCRAVEIQPADLRLPAWTKTAELWKAHGGQFPVINAVVRERAQGRLFAADEWLWVLHRAGFSQLFARSTQAWSDFLHFVRQQPDLPRYFHLYAVDEALDVALFEGFGWRDRRRRQFSFEGPAVEVSEPLLADPSVRSLNEISEVVLQTPPWDGWRVCWRDCAELLAQGFGTMALDEYGQPASICFSAAVDGERAEVDVFTDAAQRGRGHGQRAVQGFTALALARSLRPAWDCFVDNEASVALAHSCGFAPLHDYRFVSLFDPAKPG